MAADEVGVETDTLFFKIGDGVTPWSGLSYGYPSPWIGPAGSIGPPGATGATGASGADGSAAARATTTLVTASLADQATETGTVVLAKTFALGRVVADQYCRIRLYSTAAARTADAARLATVPPELGSQHGVIFDLVIDSADKLDWICSPLAYGSNQEGTPTTAIAYSVTNLSGGTQVITIDFTFTSEEA